MRAQGQEGTDISPPIDIDSYEGSEGWLLHDKDNQYALDPVASEDQRTSEDLDRPRGERRGPSESTSYSDSFSDLVSEIFFDSTYHVIGLDKDSRTNSRTAVEAASSCSTLSAASSRVPQLRPLVTTASMTSSEDPISSSIVDASGAGYTSSSSTRPSGFTLLHQTLPDLV